MFFLVALCAFVLNDLVIFQENYSFIGRSSFDGFNSSKNFFNEFPLPDCAGDDHIILEFSSVLGFCLFDLGATVLCVIVLVRSWSVKLAIIDGFGYFKSTIDVFAYLDTIHLELLAGEVGKQRAVVDNIVIPPLANPNTATNPDPIAVPSDNDDLYDDDDLMPPPVIDWSEVLMGKPDPSNIPEWARIPGLDF